MTLSPPAISTQGGGYGPPGGGPPGGYPGGGYGPPAGGGQGPPGGYPPATPGYGIAPTAPAQPTPSGPGAELRKRGICEFVLDLRECVTMDSTFLGVLAGLVLRNNHPTPESPRIELLNPNPRVLDLIENLGVLELFKVSHQEAPYTLLFETAESVQVSKEDVTRTCLEAHRALMKANPANVPKFKEVTQFMAEDLKKLSSEKGQS